MFLSRMLPALQFCFCVCLISTDVNSLYFNSPWYLNNSNETVIYPCTDYGGLHIILS